MKKVDKIIDEILAYSELIILTNIPKIILEDPDDDVIMAVAMTGNANYIISGDKHFLSVGQYQDISIVSANNFLSSFF